MKLAISVLLLFALPHACAGTPDDHINNAIRSKKEWETSVRALLDSSDRRLQAWAAWHVAQSHMNDLNSQVLEKFQTGIQLENSDVRWTHAFTDALIQTRAAVSEKCLTRLNELGYPTQALILASLTPELNKNLLFMLSKDPSSAESAAACSLLAKHHALAFTNWALNLMVPRMQIGVIDPVTDEESKSPRSFGVRNLGGRRVLANANNKVEEVWPPAVKHEVFLGPADNGDQVLVNFHAPVYYRRIVPSEETLAVERPTLIRRMDRVEYCLVLLKSLSGGDFKGEPKLHLGTVVEWKSAEQYLEQVQSEYTQFQSTWDDLILLLKDRVGPVESKVSVKVEILDLREVKKPPLPPFDEKNLPPHKIKNEDVP